ncbi:MAG: glycosyltransferase family 2 protein [Actinobacteria bacterium]|nr:glycosyltransferase family 2 protein [Actinomycetota bacterium]
MERNEERNLDLSVVIPVYNEADNVERLYKSLEEVLSKLDKSYEVLLIDDGSTDGTTDKLAEIHKRNPKYKVIQFRRNYGQTAAISAGFDYSAGNVIVTIDADLQNDPKDIPKILEKMEEGYDVVSGWRKDRKDPFLTRKVPSKIANWLVSILAGIHLHDYGCTLKAYSKDVVKNVQLYGEMHRYIPALASWIGIDVTEIPVSHHKRKFGKSKYGLSRTPRVILDLITLKFLLSYSTRPIQIFGSLGIITAFLGFLIALFLSYVKLVQKQSIGDRPLLLLAVLLIFLGFQFISMGLLGELAVRTYHEAQNKPIYFVKKILD